jgi:hypothetical protein
MLAGLPADVYGSVKVSIPVSKSILNKVMLPLRRLQA